jgi:hypothetical protein
MSDEIECPGAGKCHGCLKWCNECGDVKHVCDARLRHDRCDSHPVPPESETLRFARAVAENMIRSGKQMIADGARDLDDVIEGESARHEYDRQVAEDECKAFTVTP